MSTLACDGCRTRKVKCDRSIPSCKACKSANITCTRNLPRLKKGPKRNRNETALGRLKACTLDVIDKSQLHKLIDEFFDTQHPVTELLDKNEIHEFVEEDRPDITHRCLVMGIVAYQCVISGSEDKRHSMYLNEAIRHQNEIRTQLVHDVPKVMDIFCAFFIQASYFNQQLYQQAFIYLREAITLAQILKIDQETSYITLSPQEQDKRRKLYLLLVVTERGAGLLTGDPITLRSNSIQYPSKITPIVALAKLYTIVDGYFALNTPAAQSVSTLYSKLDSALECLPTLPGDVYRADFMVTAEWLRLLIYKSASHQQHLNTPNRHSLLATIADGISRLGTSLSKMQLQVHGIGMAMKLSAILSAIADTYHFEIPREDYQHVGAKISHLLHLITQHSYNNGANNIPSTNATMTITTTSTASTTSTTTPLLDETSLLDSITQFFENFEYTA